MSRSFTQDDRKSGGGGATSMLDGWVVIALLALVGGLIHITRKR